MKSEPSLHDQRSLITEMCIWSSPPNFYVQHTRTFCTIGLAETHTAFKTLACFSVLLSMRNSTTHLR